MGNIKFYGIIEDYEKVAMDELSTVIIPENAHIIKEHMQINEKNLLLVTLPIIILIITINEDGTLKLDEMGIIAYDPYSHGYYEVGSKVGDAFQEGKKLM